VNIMYVILLKEKKKGFGVAVVKEFQLPIDNPTRTSLYFLWTSVCIFRYGLVSIQYLFIIIFPF